MKVRGDEIDVMDGAIRTAPRRANAQVADEGGEVGDGIRSAAIKMNAIVSNGGSLKNSGCLLGRGS
jgi:hypothetical protein